MPSPIKHVFIDESGNTGLNVSNQGTTEHFVITAVIVKSNNLEEESSRLNQIINSYFPRGELKSSRVGNNRNRRNRILRDISNLDFLHYTQVINKSLIQPGSGLQHKRSFVKYIQRVLYQQLSEAYPKINIIADEYGSENFMQGFISYLRKNLPRLVLFEDVSFNFGSSRDYPFIQVADMIAGSIRRVYAGVDPIGTYTPILTNTIIIDQWPTTEAVALPTLNSEEDSEIDKIVRQTVLRQAEIFIDENARSNDIKTAAQVAAIRYLLFHYSTHGSGSFLPTTQLMKHLDNLGFHSNKRLFRKDIIGGLRDCGVIIASSVQGLKIPHNSNDLNKFTGMVESNVLPYIRRLKKAREKILLATSNELDIVSESEHPDLHRILERRVVEQ